MSFEYKDGNSIKINGKFGKVELIYRGFKKVNDVILGEEKEVASHFDAFLFDENGKTITAAEGLTEQTALISLYQKYAEFRALEDLGRI